MCRGQGRYDVILGISDGAFGSNSAMVLGRGIFDGDVFSAEEIFKLRRRLIIESLHRNVMLEVAEKGESSFIGLHIRVCRSTGHRLHVHVVVEDGNKDVLISLTRDNGKSTC